MGKVKNIKAQDISIGNELVNEVIKNEFFSGKEIKVDNNPNEKMSEIIQDFGEPLFDECETDNEREMMLTICIMIWNICLMPKDLRKEEIKRILDTLAGDDNDAYMFWSGLIKSQMFRKEMYFSQIRRFIYDYKINKKGNELRLSIVSSPIE